MSFFFPFSVLLLSFTLRARLCVWCVCVCVCVRVLVLLVLLLLLMLFVVRLEYLRLTLREVQALLPALVRHSDSRCDADASQRQQLRMRRMCRMPLLVGARRLERQRWIARHRSGPQNTGQDRFRPQNTAQDRSGPLRTSSRPLRIRLRASRPLSSAQQDTLRAHTCVDAHTCPFLLFV